MLPEPAKSTFSGLPLSYSSLSNSGMEKDCILFVLETNFEKYVFPSAAIKDNNMSLSTDNLGQLYMFLVGMHKDVTFYRYLREFCQ